MTRNILIAICVTPLLVLSCFLAGAQERNDFTNATLNDRYGFHVLALSLDQSDPTTGKTVPFAISGYYKFNGDGTMSGKDTVSNPSGIIHRSYAGAYKVNSDGTGSLVLDISPSFQPKGRFTIVDNGAAIEIVFAVNGNLNAFELRQQSPR